MTGVYGTFLYILIRHANCEGSKELLNQYGVIAVNPEKYPDVNNEAANTFIKWICSPEIQTLIGEYGVKEYGEPLFFPNAEQK